MFNTGDEVKFKENTFGEVLLILRDKYLIEYRVDNLVKLKGIDGISFNVSLLSPTKEKRYSIGDKISIKNIPYPITLVEGDFRQSHTHLFIKLPREIYSYTGFVEVLLEEVSLLNA